MNAQTKKTTTDLNALAGTEVVFRSRKAGREQEVNLTDLPESSILAILRYGAQRFINDKLGGSELEQKEAAEKFDAILAQLKEGWVDQRGGGGGASPIDPVEKKAQELARDQVKKALRAKGIKLNQVGKEKMAELTSGLLEKNRDDFIKQAQRIVEIENDSLDLGSLDLGDL